MSGEPLETVNGVNIGVSADAPPALIARILPALARRLRLRWLRLRYRRAHFGNGSDIRPGLHLQISGRGAFKMGSRCVLDRSMTIECSGHLHIGDRVIFGHHCTLAAVEYLAIGDDCLIAEMVSIRDHDHRFDRLDIPVREQGAVSAPVHIGRNVWLGAKVTVVKGVRIGDNAVIGANAIVTRDIPANAVAAGVPARVLRYRTET